MKRFYENSAILHYCIDWWSHRKSEAECEVREGRHGLRLGIHTGTNFVGGSESHETVFVLPVSRVFYFLNLGGRNLSNPNHHDQEPLISGVRMAGAFAPPRREGIRGSYWSSSGSARRFSLESGVQPDRARGCTRLGQCEPRLFYALQ